MSGTIHPKLLKLLDDWTLGSLASVNEDGSPNLSPKGTFLALDEKQLAFADIRSPNTMRNIAREPRVAVNILDVFERGGAMFEGNARYVEKESDEYKNLFPRFHAIWGDKLCALFKGLVVIEITSAKPVKSPSYDVGATEMELRALWLEKFTTMQKALIDG
ncbi:MAG: pyridoxamine 5'-phosphate oxidase family protein [Pseudomonadota bacterium]